MSIKKMIFGIIFVLSFLGGLSDTFAYTAEFDKILKDLNKKEKNREWIDCVNFKLSEFASKYPQKVLKYSEQARDLSVKLDYKVGEVEALNCIINIYSDHDQDAVEKSRVKETLQNFREDKYEYGEYRLKEILAKYYSRKIDYEKAFKYVKEMVNLSIRSKHQEMKDLLPEAYHRCGAVKYNSTDYSEALNFYRKSLKVSDSDPKKFKGIRALVRSDMGRLYGTIEYYDEAIDNFQKAAELLRHMQDSVALVDVYANIGTAYLNLRIPDSSSKYFELSYKMAKVSHNVKMISDALVTLGFSRLEAGRAKEAIEYALEAIKIRKNVMVGMGNVIAYQLLAQAYQYNKEYKKGIEAIKESNKILLKRPEALVFRSDNALIAAKLYMANKDYPDAAKCFDEYTILNDSIKAQGNISKLRNDINKVDIESKERQIGFLTQKQQIADLELQRKNAIVLSLVLIGIMLTSGIFILVIVSKNRKKTTKQIIESKETIEKLYAQLVEKKQEIELVNNELVDSIAMKDKIMSIVAHDLKNPLAAIVSMSELCSTYFNRMEPKQLKENYEKIHLSAVNMNDLLHTMLDWAMNKDNSVIVNPVRINANTALNEVLQSLQLNFEAKKLNVMLNIDIKSEDIFGDEKMIATIFRNLLTNAMKFSEEGKIIKVSRSDIELIKDNKVQKMAKFMFSDEGVGMTADQIDKLFTDSQAKSTKGTANETGTGLGLSLCKEFVLKNNGIFQILSDGLGKGTTVIVCLPLAE